MRAISECHLRQAGTCLGGWATDLGLNPRLNGAGAGERGCHIGDRGKRPLAVSLLVKTLCPLALIATAAVIVASSRSQVFKTFAVLDVSCAEHARNAL